jgi:ABC-type transport system involved in Fe-S cluster assembly fused permease/ATPase subunit
MYILFSMLRPKLRFCCQLLFFKKASVDTFAHLHRLGHSYHIGRRTGGVLRIIDRFSDLNLITPFTQQFNFFVFVLSHYMRYRGAGAISTLFSFVLFNIIPTCFEVG